MRVLALVAFCLLPVCAAAGFYKWVDDQGQVHYSATPPEKGAQRLDLGNYQVSPEARAAAEGRLESTRKLLQALEEEREHARKEERKAQSEAVRREQLAARCRELKNQRDMMQAGGRWYTDDGSGERHWLSDEEVLRQVESMSEALRNHCVDMAPM